jgi:hypothetical protein
LEGLLTSKSGPEPKLPSKGIKTVDFSTKEEFELHVHKCFGKIFDDLMKVDALVKEGAEKEEVDGKLGVMNELRDYVEDVILHCHLAWQYHRLSRMVPGPVSTWDKIETEENKPASASVEKG